MARKFTDKEFRKALNKDLRALNKYDGKRKKILIECLRCGDKRKKFPRGLINGNHVCAVCAQTKLGIKNRLSEKEVKKILIKKSIKILSKFNGIMKKAKLKCLECKRIWNPTRLSETLYINNGCEICSKRFNGAYSMDLFKRKPHLKKEKGITYFIKCTDKKENFYKIGITKQKWRQRMRKIPYKIKRLFVFSGYLPQCTKLEIEIKKKFKEYRYRPNKYFAGMAECLKLDRIKLKIIKKIIDNHVVFTPKNI
jgi:hypothetical protein